MVCSTSKHDVYVAMQKSIDHWNLTNSKNSKVLDISGHVVPSEEHPGSLMAGVKVRAVSAMAVAHNLLILGGIKGELICKSLNRQGVSFCSQTADTANDKLPLQSIEIYKTNSGAVNFMFSINKGIKIYDVERFQLSRKILNSNTPLNHISLSPNGKELLVAGDLTIGRLQDFETGRIITYLGGHHDYLISCAWHPNGWLFATGSRDKTCRVWDSRKLSESVCTLPARAASVGEICFSPDGRFMAMSEIIDNVHVYNVEKVFKKEQEIDPIGDISGISFSPDSEWLFVGVHDHQQSGCSSLLQYSRWRSHGDTFLL